MSVSFTEAGAADDSSLAAGLVTDTGSADDSAFTVATALTLTEAATADDGPWEYAAIGAASFPYYASVDAAALGRVNVGDTLLVVRGGLAPGG